MLKRFALGDILTIAPATADDPEALARKGQRVKFLRYHYSGHAIVERESVTLYFRPEDLRVEAAAPAPRGQLTLDMERTVAR